MRLLVLSAAIAATVMGALPASAQLVVREGGTKVVVGAHDRDRDHNRNWRRHRAECREVSVRTRQHGRIVYKTRRVC